MPYILHKSNGKILATIADGSINASSTSLTFVGRNYAGYGDILNQNILKLLENFSNNAGPSNPLTGQLWYDNVNQVLNVYNGSTFKSLTSFSFGINQPVTSITGDLWFNTSAQQLSFYNGSSFVVIGPQQTAYNGTTISAATSLDVSENQHYVLNFTVTDTSGIPKVIAVASKDEFSVSPTDPLYNQNFTILKQGITLPTSDPTNGNSISNPVSGSYYFWGTAATSRALVYATTAGQPAQTHNAEEFLLTAQLTANLGPNSIGVGPGLWINNYAGLTLGSGKEFRLNYLTSGNALITNQLGGEIDFQVLYNNTTTTILSISGGALVPGVNTAFTSPGIDLGTPSNQFSSIYVNTVTTKAFTSLITTATNATVTGSLNGNVGTFNVLSATNYLYAFDLVSTYINAGVTTVTNLYVTGNEVVSNNLSVYGSLAVSNNITAANISANSIQVPPGSNMTGNLIGNVNASILTATNAYFTNITVTGNTYASGNTYSPQGSTLYTNVLHSYDTPSGTGLAAGATITGQWTITTGSNFTLQQGATMMASYADLAERYHADKIYDYGTVLVIGGVNEVTTTDQRAAVNVAGVVSKNPAYTLNVDAGNDDTHPYIALKGRVYCKVVGYVSKGDRLVTSQTPGYAEVFQEGDSVSAVIGHALESSDAVSSLIEIKV